MLVKWLRQMTIPAVVRWSAVLHVGVVGLLLLALTVKTLMLALRDPDGALAFYLVVPMAITGAVCVGAAWALARHQKIGTLLSGAVLFIIAGYVALLFMIPPDVANNEKGEVIVIDTGERYSPWVRVRIAVYGVAVLAQFIGVGLLSD